MSFARTREKLELSDLQAFLLFSQQSKYYAGKPTENVVCCFYQPIIIVSSSNFLWVYRCNAL